MSSSAPAGAGPARPALVPLLALAGLLTFAPVAAVQAHHARTHAATTHPASPHDAGAFGVVPAAAGPAPAAGSQDGTLSTHGVPGTGHPAGAVDHTAMALVSGQPAGPSLPTNTGRAAAAAPAADPGPALTWSAVGHTLRDGALALPLVAVALLVATAAAAGVRRRLAPARPLLAAGAVGLVQGAAASAALALASPAHALFGPQVPTSVATGVAEVLAVTLPLTLVLAVAAALSSTRRRPAATAPRHRRRVLTAVVASVAVGLVPSVAVAPGASAAPPPKGGGGSTTPPTSSGVCPSGARPVSYDISAFQVAIPVNGWGDVLPNGLVYALNGRDARVGKAQMTANPNLTQPLVVRANVGDCITVKLKNDIKDRRVGIHADGLVQFDPKTSDGARVGANPDTTVAPGGTTTYTWYADRVGEAPLTDVANVDPSAAAASTVQRGLYGALVVHPEGSTWTNQKTGANLLDPATGRAVETQLFADVTTPSGAFRSVTVVYMDENEGVKDRNGNQPTFPSTGLADSTFGFNYRSEPLRNRQRAIYEHRGTVTPENPSGTAKTITLPNGKVFTPSDNFCNGWVPELGKVVDDPGAKCLNEESHLQSWVFGDEGKLVRTLRDGTVVVDSDNLIPKAYVGDPVQLHVVHPGAKETHPFHQHTQRWYKDPNNPDSPRNDVQSVGPGEAYRMELEGGAGGTQRTVGDSIFHCHLYPHFAQGMWGHLRIFDKLRDGTQEYADGTPIEALRELPTRKGLTAAPTARQPGFPLFVKGDFAQRAYRAPNAVVKDQFAAIRRPGDAPRGPTALEAAGLPALDPAKPGNGYIDPCPTGAPTRTYRPHVVDVPITYNSAGWKDRQGRVYVEEAQAAAVRDGTVQPEPYTIRARLGECVQILTTNDLHLDEDPGVPLDHVNRLDGDYMKVEETAEVSTHVHLVRFDELASDGTSVGWNYSSSAMPGQTYGYRWFVDQPLRTVFFHDHQYGNLHQQKGLFAAMNVEPADATWHDPKTGAQTNGVGTVADIRSASGPDFREISVFHQDRAPMWRDNGNGDPVNPPEALSDYGADQGGYALNYRNEPFQIRTKPGAPGAKGDPAYVYSSAVHGDPSTPVFRAYHQDPVVIRNVDGASEEVHTFNVHGHRWLNEPDNANSAYVDNQSLSVSEYFNYEVKGDQVGRKPQGAQATLDQARGGMENGVPAILDGGAGAPGDYLYGSTPLDDQWLGMWGIFRVPDGRVSDLQPLPDRDAPTTQADPWPALAPGEALNPRSPQAVNTCPVDAPVREYDLAAIQKDIVYNAETGDHDPAGALYVRTEDEAAVRAGTKPTEPLFLRANAGDCLKVRLTNKLPATGLPGHTGDVPLPADSPFPRGNRVSIHPSMVDFDVKRADGATVGYNFDQTVAPGQSITAYWHVRPEMAGVTTTLVDFGDRRGHRHHGLFGGLLVEPRGSTWHDPATDAPIVTGAAATIRWTDSSGVKRAYREHAIDWEDGLNLRTKSGAAIPPAGDVDDPYELGNRGVNYRTERFAPRLAADSQQANVFSSAVHGDPATPIIRAYAGDPVKVRLLSSSDRGRAHTFVLTGHGWNYQPLIPTSTVVSARGLLVASQASTHDLLGGAGGPRRSTGDFLYRDGNQVNQTNAGLWGLLRVHPSPQPDLVPLSP